MKETIQKKTVKKKAAAKRPAKKTAQKAVKKSVAPKPATPAPAALPDQLIGKGEPPAYRVENAKGQGKCVIVCDHASNLVPQSLSSLGLSKPELQRHIAWDPGTEEIGRKLGQKLDAPVVLASYSRLVVDLNRGHDHPDCMREVSDHTRIPGNKDLDPTQKKQRLAEFFWPYHKAIDAQVQRYLVKGVAPVLISVHSFTPKMDGFKRPWHIGVLWNKEEGIALQLVENLRKNNPELRIGENEPYSLKSENFTKNTVSTHAESRGLPYVIVEFRQDLVGTKAKAEKWAGIFLGALAPILKSPGLYRLRRDRG